MKRLWKWILSGVAASCLTGGTGAQETVIVDAPQAGPIATALPGPTCQNGNCGASPFADGGETCSDSALQLSIGQRVWFSTGRSTWNFTGPNGVPNVVSELKWRNLDAVIAETNVNAVFNNRFVTRLDVGIGSGASGDIEDADYAGNDRTGLFSLTTHDVNDVNVFYVNADFGLRLLSRGDASCGRSFTLDALVGYQYWYEEYEAVNATRIVPPGPPFVGPVFHESWNRHSVRAGFQGNATMGKFGVDSRVMFVPWTNTRMVDQHLVPGTTFLNQSDGGFGVMWDITASYRFTKNLSAEVGYQIMYQETDTGDNLVFNGATTPNQVGELSTFRHGILVGLKWRF